MQHKFTNSCTPIHIEIKKSSSPNLTLTGDDSRAPHVLTVTVTLTLTSADQGAPWPARLHVWGGGATKGRGGRRRIIPYGKIRANIDMAYMIA